MNVNRKVSINKGYGIPDPDLYCSGVYPLSIKHIKVGHYRPASEKAFEKRFAGWPEVARECMLVTGADPGFLGRGLICIEVCGVPLCCFF